MAKKVLAAVVVAAAGAGASAEVVSYDFSVLVNNSSRDMTPQLSVTVSNQGQSGNSIGPGQVSFMFRNIGPEQGSITDVYFDDGTLLGIATIRDSSGVTYNQGASPSNLPGGNLINFQTTAGFSADSSTISRGVDSDSEWLEIVFNLINGKTFADTIRALNGEDLDHDGIADLRIGLKIRGMRHDKWETYVNNPGTNPPNPVPLPTTAGLAAAGLLMVGARRRR